MALDDSAISFFASLREVHEIVARIIDGAYYCAAELSGGSYGDEQRRVLLDIIVEQYNCLREEVGDDSGA